VPTTPPQPPACTAETLQLHSHRCGACGYIWHHRCATDWGEDQKVQAHTCPRCAYCGERPWPIYRGAGSQAELVASP
jgi:hypothetical protein